VDVLEEKGNLENRTSKAETGQGYKSSLKDMAIETGHELATSLTNTVATMSKAISKRSPHREGTARVVV
jgi:hypothetical protein